MLLCPSFPPVSAPLASSSTSTPPRLSSSFVIIVPSVYWQRTEFLSPRRAACNCWWGDRRRGGEHVTFWGQNWVTLGLSLQLSFSWRLCFSKTAPPPQTKAEWEGTSFDLRLMIASLVLERMKGGLCDESVTIQQSWAGLLKQLHFLGFPGGSVVKNLPASPGDMGLIPGLRRSCMPWST